MRPLAAALDATRAAVDDDAANSYLPFPGHARLRAAAAAHVSRLSGVESDWERQCLVSAGGLNGILNALLAIVEPGDEVVLTDPIYIGLTNRVRLTGATPRASPRSCRDPTAGASTTTRCAPRSRRRPARCC